MPSADLAPFVAAVLRDPVVISLEAKVREQEARIRELESAAKEVKPPIKLNILVYYQCKKF